MSTFALKILAMVSMLLDHIGYAFSAQLPMPLVIALRTAGRLAMPLFCFMIAEGLFHTKDARKYLLRLLTFALVSEVPFDLFSAGTVLNWRGQNVGITLFLGLLGILLFDTFAAGGQKGAALLAIAGTSLLAELSFADYGMFGVYYIFIFYYFRGRKRPMAAALAVGTVLLSLSGYFEFQNLTWALITLAAMGAIVLVAFYSGKPGGGGSALSRRALYLFYPLHMLLLYLLTLLFPA